MQADHWYWVGRYDGALEQAHLEFEAAGLDPHGAEFLLRGAGMEGLVLSGLGRYEEALTAVESAIAIAKSMGRSANVVTNYSTAPLRDIFAVEEAHARSSEVAGRLGPSEFNMPWINARADVIAADLLLGELGRVEVAFPQAWDDALECLAWERWLVSGRLCAIRAELALELKQPDDALTWARRALEMAATSGRKKYEVIATTTLGAALSATGLAEEASNELRARRRGGGRARFAALPLADPRGAGRCGPAARRTGRRRRASRGCRRDHPRGRGRAVAGARSRVRGRPAGRGGPRRRCPEEPSGRCLGTHHAVEVPAVGDTLELVLARVLEPQAGARHEPLDGVGDEDLGRRRERRDPRADVDGDAADLPGDRLDLPVCTPARTSTPRSRTAGMIAWPATPPRPDPCAPPREPRSRDPARPR